MEILENLGIFAIFSATITYLIQRLSQYFIDKRFKAYELELQYKSERYKHSLDLSLEVHKSDLNLLFEKSTKLHDRRLTLITKLYKHLVNLQYAMSVMTKQWKLSSGNKEKDEEMDRERIEKAAICYDKFSKCYSENKIFFSTDTCMLLDEIRTQFYDSHWDYTSKGRFGLSESFTRELAMKASEVVEKNIPPVLKELETDFRNILTV